MRISRLYTNQPLAPDTEVVLEERVAHYLQRVLRLRAGHALVLFNGDGCDYAGELVDSRRDRVAVQVNTRVPATAESDLRLVLVQAVSKGDRMDHSLQKATELGVAAVQPLFTERTEVRLDGARLDKRMAHWRGVVIAACEQCGRARLPALEPPRSLEAWLALDPAAPRFALAPGAERALAGVTLDQGAAELLIGPEGGFSERELKQLVLAGCTAVSLGPRILRTESAGPAALAVLQALWGDLAAN